MWSFDEDVFDFVRNIPYNWNLTLSCDRVLRRLCHVNLCPHGMFGKRGETPPLPRNCERAQRVRCECWLDIFTDRP